MWKDPVSKVAFSLTLLLVVITAATYLNSKRVNKPVGIEYTSNGNGDITLFIDPLTNCHYLTRNNGGIVPRYDAAGNHYGCKPEVSFP